MAKIAVAQSKNSPVRQRVEGPSTNEQSEVQKLAYQFFAERSFEHGHDHEDWLRAEAVIKNRKKS